MIISEATYSILIPTQLLKEQNARIYLLGIDHFMLKTKAHDPVSFGPTHKSPLHGISRTLSFQWLVKAKVDSQSLLWMWDLKEKCLNLEED